MALLEILGLAALSVATKTTDAIAKHKKDKKEYEHLKNGDPNAIRITMKHNWLHYEKKDYQDVVAKFKTYGFTNIRTVAMKSYSIKSKIKNFFKSGKVSSVSIGHRRFDSNETFFSDEEVIIRYYE